MKYRYTLIFFLFLASSCSTDSKEEESHDLTEEEIQTEMETVDDRIKKDQERLDSMKNALLNTEE